MLKATAGFPALSTESFAPAGFKTSEVISKLSEVSRNDRDAVLESCLLASSSFVTPGNLIRIILFPSTETSGSATPKLSIRLVSTR